jgi:hypothetical protein
MASAPAENTPQHSHVNVFWKKNIFPLDVVRFLGGTEEGQPGGPRGQVLEFTGPWVSLNQTPLLTWALSQGAVRHRSVVQLLTLNNHAPSIDADPHHSTLHPLRC